MSGGSYDYIYSRLEEECLGRMYDEEMNDLTKDLCYVLRVLEWWQSCDSSEECYRDTLAKFKAKWFRGDRQERLKGYIDEQIGIVRSQLYSLIGEPKEEEKSFPLSRLLQEVQKAKGKLLRFEYDNNKYEIKQLEKEDEE